MTTVDAPARLVNAHPGRYAQDTDDIERQARRVRHLAALYEAENVLATHCPALNNTGKIVRDIIAVYFDVLHHRGEW